MLEHRGRLGSRLPATLSRIEVNVEDQTVDAEPVDAAPAVDRVGRVEGHDVYRVGEWLWPVHIR